MRSARFRGRLLYALVETCLCQARQMIFITILYQSIYGRLRDRSAIYSLRNRIEHKIMVVYSPNVLISLLQRQRFDNGYQR